MALQFCQNLVLFGSKLVLLILWLQMVLQELGIAAEPLTFSRFVIQEIKFGMKVHISFFL